MFKSGFTKRKTSFLKVEAVGTASSLRAVARPSSCGWRWLFAWPVLGWAPLSGSSGSVGCKESRSPQPPLCRSSRWHCKACWSLESAGWPAEAPCRHAQSSWTPLYRENWRGMWDLIIRLSRQMCFSTGDPATWMRGNSRHFPQKRNNSVLTSCWTVGAPECC